MILPATQSNNSQEGMPLAQFQRIAALARETAGLTIPESKSAMVRSRIARRMRKLSIDDVDQYIKRIETGDGEELREMIAVLTTNVTSFFREDHHFQMLSQDLAQDFAEKAKAGERVRIWSAGCSLGAEPFSIAITLLEHSPAFLGTDTRILATDIDQHVLAKAKAGSFSVDMVRDMSSARRSRYFTSTGDDTVSATPDIQRLVTFRELNLIGPWPMRGQFDLIFCRNVAIYFDEETQARIWSRFADALLPGGFLFVGHSERVPEKIGLQNAGNTAYQKPDSGALVTNPMRPSNVH